MKFNKKIIAITTGIAILSVLSLTLYSNDVTLRNGKVIYNVKAIDSLNTVRLEFEDGHVEIKNKSEMKSNKVKPVVWKKKDSGKEISKPDEKEIDKGLNTSKEKTEGNVFFPGVGINGIVIGESTPEDVLKVFGRDCKINRYSGEIYGIDYHYKDNTNYEPGRIENKSRPSRFDFSDGILKEIDIVAFNDNVYSINGANVDSTKVEIEKEFGKPIKIEIGEGDLHTWVYDGMEVLVNKKESDIIAIYLLKGSNVQEKKREAEKLAWGKGGNYKPDNKTKQTEKSKDDPNNSILQKNDFGFYFPIGIGIWSPLSIDENSSPKIIQGNLFYGEAKDIWGLNAGVGMNNNSGNMYGIQVGGFGNQIHGNANGLQIAGIGNGVDGNTTGIQIAGIGNGVDGNATGIQLGVFLNGIDGNAIGIQIAGLRNGIQGNATGIQIAGLSNFTKSNANLGSNKGIIGNATGIQIGGLGNEIEGNATGIQFGIIGNLATSTTVSWQIGAYNSSGELNYSLQTGIINKGDTNNSGLQIGAYNSLSMNFSMQWGGINYAKESKGIQVGVINYTSEKAKFQLGVLNIAWKNPIPIMPIVNFYF